MINFAKGHLRLSGFKTIPDAPRRILMTRSAEDCAGVAGLLQPLGDALVYFQPFVTQPQKLLENDVEILRHAADENDTTLVFTSPRAIEALRATAPEFLAAWRQKLVFAVGPGTAATLAAEGFTHIDAAAGDSSDLAARLRLLAREHNIHQVLQLAGSVTAADLAASLAGSDMTVRRVVVYHAALLPVPADLARDMTMGAVTDVVLLSARVAEHMAPLMSQAPRLPRLYCLSERIAVAARRTLAPQVPFIAVAPQPLLSALVPLLVAPPAPMCGSD